MTKREEILKYGLSFLDVYSDTPFRDDNWVLLRYRKNKKAFAWTYERNRIQTVHRRLSEMAGVFSIYFQRRHWRNWKTVMGLGAASIGIMADSGR